MYEDLRDIGFASANSADLSWKSDWAGRTSLTRLVREGNPVCRPRNMMSQAFPAVPRAQYGGRHTVTLLPGDGVGPELMDQIRHVFRCASVPVDFEEVRLDHTVDDEQYEHALLAIKRNGVAMKGNVESEINTAGFKSRNVELRSELDLFANVVWCHSIPGVATRHRDVDIVIIRENTEGEYSNLEHESVGGVVESLKIITAMKSTRIARYAFDFASRMGRRKVTAVHKANIMKQADGLFLECCKNVSEEYPKIEFDSMIVDNCSMQMVSRPQQFDVMVLPNLYGNIIANIGAGLVGGPGVVAGANFGHRYAVYEMGTRGTGKEIAGKNLVNPAGMLLASADMLNHLSLDEPAELIRESVMKVLSDQKMHTQDIGGQATTSEVIECVIEHIQSATQW